LAWSLAQWRSVRLETDITRFLPEGNQRDRLALSGLVKATGFSRGLVIDIAVPDSMPSDAATDAAATMVTGLASDLASSTLFKSVRTGPGASTAEDFQRLYFPRRLAFLSDDPQQEVPRLFSPDGLAAAMRRLKDALVLPTGPLVKSLAPSDPLMSFADLLQRAEGGIAKLAPRQLNGQWYSADLRHALILTETTAAAFDTDAQRAAMVLVRDRFAARNAEAGGGYVLSFTGLGRFVTESEDRAKSDISFASISSTIACALLFLMFFRRLRFLVLAFLPVSIGVAAAVGVLAGFQGSIHGLTLGFGGVLIGACIDYPIHLLNGLRTPPEADDVAQKAAARAMRRNLGAGVVTSLSGFLVLCFSDYPGIREIAVFCMVGIAVAFASTVLFLPPLKPWLAPRPGGRPATAFHIPIDRALAVLRRHRAVILGLLVVMAVAATAMLPSLRLEQDARALDAGEPVTLAEDAAIRSHLPSSAFPRVVLASGSDLQQALARSDTVHADLAARRAAGTGPDFASMHALLPSAELQQGNLDTLAALPDPATLIDASLRSAGFRPERFQPFITELGRVRDGLVHPLLPSDLAGTSLDGLLQGFTFTHADRAYVLTLAGPEVTPGDLLDLEKPDGSVTVMDPRALVSSLVTSSQRQTLALVATGVLLNIILIAAVRRRPRLALATLAPTLLTLLVVTGGIAALGIPLNFLHVVSLLLILCMGIDLGLFLLDDDAGTAGGAGAAPTVLLSALTTAVSFGLMGFCRTSALVSVGVTVGVGIAVLGLLTFAVRALAFGGLREPT
jgi:predicted exporter